MNYSRKATSTRLKLLTSSQRRILSKINVFSFRMLLVLFVALVVCGTAAAFGILKGIIDNAPSIETIDVSPDGYSTKIYDSAGNITQTLVGQDANRIYVSLDQIPVSVQNAFIAIEDARFREHNGIDIRGIFRAGFAAITEWDLSQGASTITQQLIKNTVFDGGLESTDLARIKRKIQEQYLAVQLEDVLDKDTILEYYLNTINLGQNTLGVEAASRRYFGKHVNELTISEASVIAGITQNPSQYNPISHPDDNREKRAIVLEYMREQGFIDDAIYNDALSDDVYTRIAEYNESYSSSDSNSVSSYFNDALFEQALNDLKEQLGYTETQAYNALYRGGLSIYSTQDSEIQKICDKIIEEPSYYPANTEYQLSYQLTVIDENGKETNYNEQTMKAYFLKKEPSFDIYFKEKKSAKPYIKKYKKHILKQGGEVLGENINYILQPQVSFVLMDQKNGQVLALVGGRGKKTGSRTLNRATNSLRQPGSTFKILSTYLPAFDTAGMTLSTTQIDEKYYYPGTNKQVRNWNGEVYKGVTTLREGIVQSMNVVTVKTLEQVTPKTAFDYLVNLGISSIVDSRTAEDGKIYSDIQLPMALGGLTDGVSNLELTAAYASIANKGVYTEPILYTKILDHDGNVLLEKTPAKRQVFKDSTAFLLTSAMEDVIDRGTGTLAKFTEIDMAQAGKTGTTSSDIDLWFEGFTPYYTAGIWGGWDLNKDQDNTTYHKILWKTIMEKVHEKKGLKNVAFKVPDSVKQTSICSACGKLAVDACSPTGTLRTEYYAVDNIPKDYCSCHNTETTKGNLQKANME
ncbi:MAG: glycosyl transferase [Lachnospiraceae bacterium]|nr:glycosyl transferase [Lachnospiraceae bacterium]